MSLPAAARELLAPVYGWFTEGFQSILECVFLTGT